MTFKKDDRVRLIKDNGDLKAGAIGTVRYTTSRTAAVKWDDTNEEARHWNGPSFDQIELYTPLSFSNVRTGDKITVEVGSGSITGPADLYSGDGIYVMGWRISGSGGNWYGSIEGAISAARATLTAHEPVEPEWHRAKVIKADGYPAWPGSYLLNHAGAWRTASGAEIAAHCLSNVTIIVDEFGKVVT